LACKLAAQVADLRDPARVIHPLPDILRARILAIACGYEDADDLDHLRSDPGLKLACGRLPDTGRDLPSQPTVSRWENAPSLREVIGLMRIMDHGDDSGQILTHLGRQPADPGLWPRFARFQTKT